MERELKVLQQHLGHAFADLALLVQALTHRSYANEHPGRPHNERLEFLGDAVLGVVVSERLYRVCSDSTEGELSQRRASLVNTRALARVARALELGALLQLGRGEQATGGADKTSLLADAVEAVIGATYVDGGLDAATGLIDRLFGETIAAVAAQAAPRDYKSELQELLQRQGQSPPTYALAATSGPDHARRYAVEVVVELAGVERRAQGEGSSKKQAERAAAAALLAQLDASESA